jgi:hypothetical protein
MNRFADLLDMLVFTPSRNAKLKLLRDYFRRTPDPGARLCACGDCPRSRHHVGQAGA